MPEIVGAWASLPVTKPHNALALELPRWQAPLQFLLTVQALRPHVGVHRSPSFFAPEPADCEPFPDISR